MRSFFIVLAPVVIAATPPTGPARHPTPPADLDLPYVFVFNPYAPGKAAGIASVTPLAVSCNASQGIGFANDGGALSISCVDSTTQQDVVSPQAPPANGTTIYQFALDSGFPPITTSVSSVWPTPFPVGYLDYFSMFSTTQSYAPVKCAFLAAWGDTTLGYVGENTSQGFTTAGTAQGVSWANTNLLTRMKSAYYATPASPGNSAAIKPRAMSVWRGNAANAGGFLVWARLYMQATGTKSRFAMGIFNNAALLNAAQNPSTQTNSANSVYIGCDIDDTNLNLCQNDSTGAAVCSPLGASFPCKTANAFYDFWFSAAPNGEPINYYVERLDVAAVASGQFTGSEVPATNIQLSPQAWMNTGDGGTAIGLGFVMMCIAANL